MKKNINCRILSVALFGLVLACHLSATTRMQRLSWTDRRLTHPPLTEPASLESTIDHFWNDSLISVSVSSDHQPKQKMTQSVCRAAKPVTSAQVKQSRITDEHRGFFGINLLNAIPLIDFVHGEVHTQSADHVNGRK